MKNLIYLLPVLFLASCQPDSAFGGGYWIVPVGLGLASAYSVYKYYITKGKGPLVYAVILAAAMVYFILSFLNDK